MSLLALPPNLKLAIVNALDPRSALDFALTCQEHLGLCRNSLQEAVKLASEWSVVSIAHSGPALRGLLKNVLQDPGKGWHVKELRISGYAEEDESENVTEEENGLFTAAAMDIMTLYCHEPQFFLTGQPNTRMSLGEALTDGTVLGSENSIIAVLLHNLPHIETFRLETRAGRCTSLAQMMRSIADGYQDTTIAPHLPLQRLKNVAMSYNDTEGCLNIDWACYFLCIPSLRTFAAWAMGSEGVTRDSEDHLRPISTPVSNVEELFFHRCQFDTPSLETILPLVTNLRRFTYAAGGATVAYSYYEPKKVIRALLKHASHSLEELVLEAEERDYIGDEDDIPVVSLREFQRLRSLNCELKFLLRSSDAGDSDIDEALSEGFLSEDSEESIISDPRERLPNSLEELYLHGVFDENEWEQLNRIFEEMRAATPNLTLDNTCIQNMSSSWKSDCVKTRIGNAPPPQDIYIRPLAKLLGP